MTGLGNATISGTFGDPGGHGYNITVNWSDGTVQTFYFADPGTFHFAHSYSHNPDPTNPAAPIPITVTVQADPNISLAGLHQPLIVTHIDQNSRIVGEVDTTMTSNGSVSPAFSSWQTEAALPGLGLGGVIFVDSNIYIIVFQHSVAQSTTSSLSIQTSPMQQSLTYNPGLTVQDDTTIESRQIINEVLDADGNVLGTFQLSEEILDDLPKLFRQLPDGHYRIYVKEPGEQGQRLLLDINIRGGKPADDTEAGDKPPTAEDEAPADPDAPQAALPPGAAEDAPLLGVLGDLLENSRGGISGEQYFASGFVTAIDQHSDVASTDAREPTDESAVPAVAAAHMQRRVGSAALGLGALVASLGQPRWEDRVDEALAQADSGTLSKAARLARRLRRLASQRIHRFGPESDTQ
jgi:hypothetical protein